MTWPNSKSKGLVRPLTPNEKFLLTLLGLIAFVGVNFFGYRALSQRQATLSVEQAQLRGDQAEAQVSLQDQGLWQTRRAWVTAHQPVATNEDDAKAQTLQFILAGVRGSGLEVVEQSLSSQSSDPGTLQVEVVLTIKGPMQGLAQWLAGLQDPASFYAVPFLSLKADDDKKSMLCTLHISRYFSRPGI